MNIIKFKRPSNNHAAGLNGVSDGVAFMIQLHRRLAIPGELDELSMEEYLTHWQHHRKCDPKKHALYMRLRYMKRGQL